MQILKIIYKDITNLEFLLGEWLVLASMSLGYGQHDLSNRNPGSQEEDGAKVEEEEQEGQH